MKYDDDLDFEEIKLSDSRKKTDWRVFLVIAIAAAAVLALVIFLIVNAGGKDRPPEDEKMPVAETQAGDEWPEQAESESAAEENDTEAESEVTAISSYLTTDLEYRPKEADSGDGIKTQFTEVNDIVTAKIEVNLRALQSVTNPDATVIAVLHNGETVTRTGINEDYGWSRVDYNGQTLYCISSYLTTP